jgi:flagellar motor switch/type III secretory pathway protein FliN
VEAVSVLDFSWETLPRITSDDVLASREAHTRLARYFDLGRCVEVVRELFACELQGFGVAEGSQGLWPVPGLGAEAQLSADELDLSVSVEPALVSLLLNRLLGRPSPITSEKPLSPGLQAAFRTVAVELCRKLAPQAPLGPATQNRTGAVWRSDFWVRLDGASYRGRLAVGLRGSTPARCAPKAGLVPVSLRVVLLEQTLSPIEFAGMEVGDAIVFDAPWALALALKGGTSPASATLCCPYGDRGLRVDLRESGLVLRAAAQLGYEVEKMAQADTTVSQAVEAAVLDAPVVVRLEVGEVTLPARDWLALGAGDVLQTDVPLGDPVVLRVAGRVVARGTLVNVEGRLGVRLLAVTPG